MIKKLLIALVVIFVVIIGAVAVISLLTPTDCKVEREITINKPRAEVFAYLKQIKNQNAWGPWYKKDPSMKQDFRGTDGEVGFVSHWKSGSPEVGEGEQEIKRIVDGERLETELRFKEPFESRADAFLLTESAGESQTKVKWGFNTTMPRPFNLFLLVIDIDKEVGKDFQDGLQSLKAIMEKN